MPRVHWLQSEQYPAPSTMAGVRSWAWCQATLGMLGFLAPLEHPPTLAAPAPEERPALAPYRGARFVVLELPAGEGEYRPGYYL